MSSTTILNADLAAATVTYNGVQFGGADALTITDETWSDGEPIPFKATPPMYELQSQFRYDKANVNVIGIDNVLTVRTWISNEFEPELAENMRQLRARLGQPGKAFALAGMGTGFNLISSPYDPSKPNFADLDNGPHPLAFNLVPVSSVCWELTWTIRFFISSCQTEETNILSFLSFNFTTTWSNDFEGMTTRSISGSVKIPQVRDSSNPLTRISVADEIRNNITIICPPSFRRVRNDWNESLDKSELTFNVVDEYLPGDDLPTGMTLANGDLTFETGGVDDSSMTKAVVTMSMTLRTSPFVSRALAGFYFIVCALAKQTQLTTNDDGTPRKSSTGGSIAVIPLRFVMRNGKFDDCRVTSASISWLVINNFWDNLNSCNLFEGFNATATKTQGNRDILGNEDYNAWRADMNALWGNRGVSNLQSFRGENGYFNLCNNQLSYTLGNAGAVPRPVLSLGLPTLTCPALPKDDNGDVLPTVGWMHFKLRVEVVRKENIGTHRRATIPQVSEPATPKGINGAGSIPDPEVYNDPAQAHVSERQGLPTVYVIVKFAALRYSERIPFPRLGSFGGVTVEPLSDSVGSNIEPDSVAFEAFGCKIYRRRGYQIYRLRGTPTAIDSFIQTPITYSDPIDLTKPLEL